MAKINQHMQLPYTSETLQTKQNYEMQINCYDITIKYCRTNFMPEYCPGKK